ncbi:hypothetical protein ABMA27_003372 [Loxostege sticticalis]|uniref:SPIN-DOC-like zinc-finger domain-containing protein n=1 Tax=Loxostege sticticalis TaxID=481309 RepID=A0ABR3HSW8_LOXSC
MHNGKPVCLLCNESISVLKEFNIKRHYSTKHITQHTLTGQLRKDKIPKLITNLNKQQQMFRKQRTQLDNVVKASLIVNGAHFMVGSRKGFIGILNERATELNVQKDDVIVLHCIIHQQNLCSKSIRLQNVMGLVVKTINFIRSRASSRHFWMTSLPNKMIREIADFMEIKEKHIPELSDPKWLCDLAFLVDITGHLNDLNLKLQKQGQLVNELYSHLKAFQNKISLWETQMRSGSYYHFSTPCSHENVAYVQYADEMKLLSEQFTYRISDFKKMDSYFNLFATQTKSDVKNGPLQMQMELIELQEDTNLKSKFEDVDLKNIHNLRRIVCVFGSTYKCEQFFSLMKTNKSKSRTRLTDENLENWLRLCTSEIFPDINKLVSEVQTQISH